MSTLQLSRMLGITYKSAGHMARRIRYVMHTPSKTSLLKSTVEVDETYVGGKPSHQAKTPTNVRKAPVIAAIERQDGARTKVIPKLSSKA